MKSRLLLTVFASVLLLSTTSANAGEFAKCEKRNNPQRSRISVEARDLVPGAVYSATIISGANSVVASVAANTGGDAEYDFDSNPNDIFAGATAISSNFIGISVNASVTDALGNVVESGSVQCKIK